LCNVFYSSSRGNISFGRSKYKCGVNIKMYFMLYFCFINICNFFDQMTSLKKKVETFSGCGKMTVCYRQYTKSVLYIKLHVYRPIQRYVSLKVFDYRWFFRPALCWKLSIVFGLFHIVSTWRFGCCRYYLLQMIYCHHTDRPALQVSLP
jgi:hypothetical protein